MKKILNKKAFTLVEIVVAIGILAAASVGIGAIVVAVQNNSQKQFTQGDLQQQLSSVQESLKNDLLTTNAGVKYWIQDDAGSYVESDGANKNPERNKIVAMYTMDYIDNTLTKTYVKYDANEDILYKAEMSETVTFDHSKKKLLDEKPEEVADNSALDWYVYAQGITNFSMDLSKYSENQTINYNVNISHTDNNFESDNTVNVRNEIPINEATVLENYDQAVVTRPALKNRQFVYNGQEQAPKQLDVNSRYVEIRLTDPERDRVSATNVGQYRITYHLKNAVWEDGSTDDYTLEWEIIPRALTVEWTEWTWVYDGSAHTAKYLLGNNAPADNISTLVELHNGTVGPNYGTQTASLEVKNPNYTITENQEKEISITKGVAEFTVVPQPAGSADNPLVYNGQYQPLVKPGSTTCGTIYYSLSANTGFSPEIPTAKSANGENPYIVYYYIQGSGSYADSEIKYMEVVMQRALPAINKPVPYDGTNHVTYYNGLAQELLYFAGTTSAATNTDTNMLYSLDGDTYGPNIPTGVTATQYTVWYKSKETADFKETVPQYVEARISKTSRPSDSFTLPQINNLTYTGKLQPLFVPGTGTATQAASWMYKLPDGEWSTTIPEKDAAGDYEVYLKLPETADYAEYVVETPVIVKIDKAVAQYRINGKPEKLPYLTYNGQPQSLIAHGLTQDGIIQYAISQGNTPPNKEAFSEKVPQGTGAGQYNVFFYIKGDSNHYDSDILMIEAEILPANPMVTSAPVALNAPYNGEEQMLLIAQGISDNGTPLQYSLTGAPGSWSEIPPAATDVGDYTIYYKVPANENYGDSTVSELLASITQADTEITGPTGFMGLVYDGSAQYLCQEGSTQFGEFEYSINSKQQWSTNLPTATNAGTYDIYWRVLETDNYKGAEGKITVVISKQRLDVLPPEAPALTYTGESQMLLDPNSGSVPAGYHFEYRLADPAAAWELTPPVAVDANTYYIEYRVVANSDAVGGNIDTSAETIVVTIEPTTPVVLVNSVADLVYNGAEQILIDADNTTTSIGELEYSLDQDGMYTTTLPTGVDAGQYNVYWRTKYSTNLNQQSGMVLVSIDQLKVNYPVIASTQLEYTGEYQFPEITQVSPHISVIEGNDVQKDATSVGYEIVFELNSNNVLWQDGTTDVYVITWYITKGQVLPFTAPVPTSQSFTGLPQLLFSPAVVGNNAGVLSYRLVGFKAADSSEWVTYTEEEQPWMYNAPLVTDVGEYKFAYKVDSQNYENIPVTEFTSVINKGTIIAQIQDTDPKYTGDYHIPTIKVSPLGQTQNMEEEWVKNNKNEYIIQKRVKIEVSTDSGKTWKTYMTQDDPRYDSTCYLGEQAPCNKTMKVKITDELNQYVPYETTITFAVLDGEAYWSTDPTAITGLVYNGAAQALITDSSEKTGMHFEYQLATAKLDANGQLVPDKYSAQSTTIPSATNAGTYAIKVWAVAETNYKVYDNANQPQAKQEIAVLYTTIQKAPIRISSAPYLKNETLYYTGDPQSLGIVNGTLDGDFGSSYFVYMVGYYATPTSEIAAFTSSADKTVNGAKGFSASKIDSGYPKPTKKGTYIISWWVEGDANHESYYHTENGIAMAEMTARIVEADNKKVLTGLDLAYTGYPQQIFVLPYTSYTSKNIFLSLDGTTWTKDATELYNMTHKTAVGEYSIYWKTGTSGEPQGPVTATISRGTLSKRYLEEVLIQNDIFQVIVTTGYDTRGMITAYDVSEKQNRGVVAWVEEGILYIGSSAVGEKVIAPADASGLFAKVPNGEAIDVSGLDTSQTTNMSKMFYEFGVNRSAHDIHILGLETLQTSQVTNASQMFANAAKNANAVYAPGLDQLQFAVGANKTDWLKNFGANAVIKETGTDASRPSSDQDNIYLDDNVVYMCAGSLKNEAIVAAQWTATYNDVSIPFVQVDYWNCTTDYRGDGVYKFSGVIKLLGGATLEVEVGAEVIAPKQSTSEAAETFIENNVLTMYAKQFADSDIMTGTWTVTYEGTEIPSDQIVRVDALTVQVPVLGAGIYVFNGTLTALDNSIYSPSITVTVEAAQP